MTWRGRLPGSSQPDGGDDRPITPEDVAWRIGASDARPAHPMVPAAQGPTEGPTTEGPTGATSVARPKIRARADVDVERRAAHAHPVVSGTTRRILLWRDASALLFVVLIAVFAAQLVLSSDQAETAANPTAAAAAPAGPSQAALGATGSPMATMSVPTRGPVVDPSLIPNIEATPTPIPTPRPTSTPRPTPRPTVKPSSAPTAPPPPPTPVVTPTPAPPIAVIAASPQCGPAPLSVAFDASASTGETSYAWDFDDPNGGNSSEANVPHVFDGGRLTYNVTLTVTGPGGSDAAFVMIHVPCG